jgi:hypothetical protein
VYQVDKVVDNHTLRVKSLIDGAQFITLVTRTSFYQGVMLQTAEILQAAAHFSNTVESIIDKFGPFSDDKMTGEICLLTSWRGFDEAENTVEPIYEKWIDVPRMLNIVYEKWLTKGANWPWTDSTRSIYGKNNPSNDVAGTTGDNYPGS